MSQTAGVGGSSTFSSFSPLGASELSQHHVSAAPTGRWWLLSVWREEAQSKWLMTKSMFAQDSIAKFVFVWFLEKLVDDDRAVGHPVSIWGSGHFLPEMSWSTHPLCSPICVFFPPSLFFLQAEEYMWQALYFINGISLCKLIFLQTPQWIYNIQDAASFAYRLNVIQHVVKRDQVFIQADTTSSSCTHIVQIPLLHSPLFLLETPNWAPFTSINSGTNSFTSPLARKYDLEMDGRKEMY